MQQPQIPLEQPALSQPPKGGKAALQYGLIFGGGIGLVDLLYFYLVVNGTISWYYGILGPLYRLPLFLYNALSGIIVSIPVYILLFVAFLLAGLFAARSSKRASSGAIAGLMAGGIFLIVDLFIATILLDLIVVFPQIAASTPHAEVAGIESSVLVENIVYAVVADLLLLGIGAGIGALGGVMGKGQTPAYAFIPPYQPQPPFYANQNPYAQPAQPGQPGFPPQPGQFPPSPPSGQ
ncbi:MAG TPA: hypothetical protein VF458_08970 [Ktedonobacteraceae bacterium]